MIRALCFQGLLLLLLALMPVNLSAYGRVGHAVIGEIADDRLTPEAKTRIGELLDGKTLADVASWADEIRSDRRATAPFHYMNFPKEMDRPEQEHLELEQGTIYMAIVHYTDVLANPNASKEQKQEALKFVVHFIGDLHQPLHVGLQEDLGGNRVRGFFFDDATNLHRIWDSSIIEKEYGSTTPKNIETMIIMETAPETIDGYGASMDLLDWIADSRKVMNDGVYPAEETDSFRFAEDYQAKHLPASKQQLIKGGVRLAATLNAVFADTPVNPFPPLTIEFPDDQATYIVPPLFPESKPTTPPTTESPTTQPAAPANLRIQGTP